MAAQQDSTETGRGVRNFRWFWASETLTTLTTSVSSLAVPLIAVTTLHASVLQVGLLAAVGQLAFALVALPAGVFADRTRHRRAMIISNLARAGVVCAIPIANLAGVLDLWMLYAVVIAMAILQSFYEPAWHAFLPSLVGKDRLVASNGKLQATTTATDLGGKGLGGLLIQAVGPPLAIIVNAVAFALSALALTRIRHDDPRPARNSTRLRSQMAEGLRQVWKDPVLRSLAVFLVGAAAGLSAYYRCPLFSSRELLVFRPASSVGSSLLVALAA